jgi:cold shock CspA family protein
MNTAARHSGSLTSWVEAEDFGEVTLAGMQPIIVYGSDLRQAGVHKPKVGQRLDFRLDAHPVKGVTAAVDISVPKVG